VAIMASLLVCSMLYIAVCLILTGMCSFKDMQSDDFKAAPLSYVFHRLGYRGCFESDGEGMA